jgi:hypothetical protein
MGGMDNAPPDGGEVPKEAPPPASESVSLADGPEVYGTEFGKRLDRLSGRLRKLPAALQPGAMDYLDSALDEYLTAAAIGGLVSPKSVLKAELIDGTVRSGAAAKVK